MNRLSKTGKVLVAIAFFIISSIKSNSQTISTKQIENLEIILRDHYSRIVKTKRYIQYSAKNFTIVSKDATGDPTNVKFEFEYYDNNHNKTYSETGGILYSKKTPYGLIIYYYNNEYTCFTPAKIVNGIISSRTESEIEQIRKLQFKFLSLKMMEAFRELWKGYEYKSSYSCLETYDVYTGPNHDRALVRQDWKNVCSELVLIGGLFVRVNPNSIEVQPDLIKIFPNDFVPKVKISNLRDENIGNINSLFFSVYFFL